MYRSHLNNELRKEHLDTEVTLSGWVHRRRDHGGLIFIDLRDRYGLTQVVFDPEHNKNTHVVAEQLRSEYVITIKGKVRQRPDGQTNENHETGEIEVIVNEVTILNESKTPPFEIDQDKHVGEEHRLKYRYLDLRRDRMKSNILLRAEVTTFIRNYMVDNGFVEVETPMLVKGTPEGSREYLVPARLYHGNFYVLPQSPQQMKQLLMVAGFDKYFQIARCFRDEDQRGDRQPEFTQLDLEMSFVEQEDVMKLNEGLAIALAKKFMPSTPIQEEPFPVLSFHDSMNRYGSDKPDVRFDMELTDITELVKDCDFKVFSGAESVKALKIENYADKPRSYFETKLTDYAKDHGAKGLAYIMYMEDGPKAPILKFLGDDLVAKITEATGAKTGDVVFFAADEWSIACEVLGALRKRIAKEENRVPTDKVAFCWVNDFPMFEVSKETGAVGAMHHPFTRPKKGHEEMVLTDPMNALSNGYDLVMNGNEIGGGSIRIHERELQNNIFKALKVAPEDIESRFGHMLEAFEYGAPPHGGIAWGLDRLVMIFANEPNIREVIAFPKDQKAKDLMFGAPSPMPADQVAEAGVEIIKED
ncbi:MAG: aspartate--tRNA ligase [Candidatus Gracilibacteria bacterium]|nr:aspartate--tRNA ligase [Candidatus Gracilibacteria bacterium]